MQEHLKEEFLMLHEKYADVVFRMCLAKVSSREEAKDIAQETFVRVWERLSSRKDAVENMRAFLFTVARNLIKDYYKRKKPVLERDLPEGAMEHVSVPAESETRSDAALALRAIGELPPAYREVLHLHLVEGYGVGEIAEMLSERPNTISVRIKRGLQKIRVNLRIETP